MSITDDTTGLDTTWTEETVVAFTSGTLSTISDCVSYVETKLRRGTISTTTVPTTANVQTELIRAKEELCEVMGFTWQRRYAYADTVASTFRYALPPDYFGSEVSLRDTTTDWKLKHIDRHRFDLLYPDVSKETGNNPTVFTIKNNEVWLCPAPDKVYRLELEYSRSGDDNTTTDISYLPEVLRFKCCDFAIFQSFRMLHMWQESAMYRQDWMDGMLKAKRSDSKKKWASVEYQALSCFQVYHGRYNQSVNR